MITPIELQSKTFKTGIGFDKKDVEFFISSLLGDYETLYKENVELKDKCNVLNEGINYYKTIEKTIQKALVLAEKTAEETKEAARKEAHAIKEEAKTKAKFILMDAQNELEKVHQQTLQLIRQYESYKAQFKYLAEAQQELLESDAFNIHIANLDAFVNQRDVIGDEKTNNLNKGSQTNTQKNVLKDTQKDMQKNEQIVSQQDNHKSVQIDNQMDKQKTVQIDTQMDIQNDDSMDAYKDIHFNVSLNAQNDNQNDIFGDDQKDNDQNKDVYDDFEFLNVSDEDQR